jgi:ankyrin repeat protein
MLEKRMATLPSTLAETYSRILENIPDDYRPNAIKILQFLTYSEYPISLDEAVDIIATDLTKDPSFEVRNRMRKANETLLLCSSLVSPVTRTLIERSTQTKERIEIHLAHFSVKEFLRSGIAELEFCEHLREDAARASIVQVCLAYLSSLKLGLQLQRIRLDYPLAQLSAKIWMSSAAAAESDKNARNMLLRFFSYDRRAYANWCRLITLQDLADTTTATDPHFNRPAPLYHVALLGLNHTMAGLLQSNDYGPIQANDFMYALEAATKAGECRMVELLVQHQQRFEKISQGESFLSAMNVALREASSIGYEQIVKVLIHKGADVNAQGGPYDTVLQAAASKGHEGIVNLLLNAGADINARGKRYGTALLAATFEERQQVVQILLARGADTAFVHATYGTALRTACLRNHAKIVGMLLENDACYAEEFCAAAYEGCESIVSLLLNAGANIDARDGYYGTALFAAASGEQKQIVQILLARGADTALNLEEYGTALRIACVRNHAKIVRMLLKNDVDKNELDRCYAEELCAAAALGHDYIVHLLLRKGARLTFKFLLAVMYPDCTTVGPHFLPQFTKKVLAFIPRDLTTVGLLILPYVAKEEVFKRDAGSRKTLLHWAVETGYEALTDRCLELGAEVDAVDVHGETALHYAARNRRYEIVKILIRANADSSVVNSYSLTALECAHDRLGRPYPDIVAYLEQGAGAIKPGQSDSSPPSYED